MKKEKLILNGLRVSFLGELFLKASVGGNALIRGLSNPGNEDVGLYLVIKDSLLLAFKIIRYSEHLY